MINIIAAELRRIRKRSTLLGALAMVAIAILTTTIVFTQAQEDKSTSPGVVQSRTLEAPDGLVATYGFASLILGAGFLVIFARAVTNDYQHSTLKVLLTREPRRLMFAAGKFVATTAFATATLIAIALAMLATASTIAAIRGLDLSEWWTWEGIGESTVGFLRLWAASMVWGLYGFALGTLLRAAGPAIGVGIGSFALGGHLLENFVDNAAEWFPSLVMAIFVVGGADGIKFATAALMTAVYAAVFAAASIATTRRGDVPG